jgi:hypothetical protein
MIGIYRKKRNGIFIGILILKFPIHLCSYFTEFDIYTSTTVTSVFMGGRFGKS